MSITMTTAPKQQLQEDWDAAVEFKRSILSTTTHKCLGPAMICHYMLVLALVINRSGTLTSFLRKKKTVIHHHEGNQFPLQTKSFTRSIKVLFPSVGRQFIMLKEYK